MGRPTTADKISAALTHYGIAILDTNENAARFRARSRASLSVCLGQSGYFWCGLRFVFYGARFLRTVDASHGTSFRVEASFCWDAVAVAEFIAFVGQFNHRCAQRAGGAVNRKFETCWLARQVIGAMAQERDLITLIQQASQKNQGVQPPRAFLKPLTIKGRTQFVQCSVCNYLKGKMRHKNIFVGCLRP